MSRDDHDLFVSLWAERDALFRFAMKFLRSPQEAEDLVHDSFVKMMAMGEAVDDVTSQRSWMFKVVRNLCIDHLRMRQRRSDRTGDSEIAASLHGQTGRPVTPEGRLVSSDRLRQTLDAIQRLPSEEAQTLTLRIVEGLSYAEIAHVTDVPVGTVRSRLSRARRMLRSLVEDEPGDTVRMLKPGKRP